MKPLFITLCVVSILVFLSGIVMIVRHWPYGHIVLDAGIVALAAVIFLAIKLKQ